MHGSRVLPKTGKVGAPGGLPHRLGRDPQWLHAMVVQYILVYLLARALMRAPRRRAGVGAAADGRVGVPVRHDGDRDQHAQLRAGAGRPGCPAGAGPWRSSAVPRAFAAAEQPDVISQSGTSAWVCTYLAHMHALSLIRMQAHHGNGCQGVLYPNPTEHKVGVHGFAPGR